MENSTAYDPYLTTTATWISPLTLRRLKEKQQNKNTKQLYDGTLHAGVSKNELWLHMAIFSHL